MENLNDIAPMSSPSSSPLPDPTSLLDNKPTFFISSDSSEEDINRTTPHPTHAKSQQTIPPPPPNLHWLHRNPGTFRRPSSPRPCRTFRPATPPELLNFLGWNPSPTTYEPFVDSPAIYPAKVSPPLASDSDEDLPGLCSLKPSPPPDYSPKASPPKASPPPKRFSSRAFIQMKPVENAFFQMKPIEKPDPTKPIKFNIDQNETFETVVRSTITTRTISSPRAILTSHKRTTTTTTIKPNQE